MTKFAENPTTTKTTQIQMDRIKATEIAQLVAFHSSQSKMSFAMESKFDSMVFVFRSFVQFISVVGLCFFVFRMFHTVLLFGRFMFCVCVALISGMAIFDYISTAVWCVCKCAKPGIIDASLFMQVEVILFM